MKKPPVNIRHYWAKTVDGNYEGQGQQLAIELFITAICLSITIYSAFSPGLELFFAGFLIPTVLFALGSLSTIYYMVDEYRQKKKIKVSKSESKDI